MEALKEVAGTISGILVVIAIVPYIRAILQRKTKPSKATWLIWTILAAVTAGGMYQAGTLNTQIFLIAIGDVAVVVLAFKYGTPGWKPIEYWTLIGAIFSIALWIATEDPWYAIVISLGTNFLGSLPTFTKTWMSPDSEDPTAWTIIATSSALQILAITTWSMESALQPVTFFMIQGTMVLLVFARPRRFMTKT